MEPGHTEPSEWEREGAEAEAEYTAVQQPREEEQRRYKVEQRRYKVEQQRRFEQSQQKTLIEYIEACHRISLAVQYVTKTTTTKTTTHGDTTKRAGRIFPRRIVPWQDFPTQQEKVWEKLSVNNGFSSKRIFPSSHQLDFVTETLCTIGSESSVQLSAHQTVETHIRKLTGKMCEDDQLRTNFRLYDNIRAESCTNTGQDESKDSSGVTYQFCVCESSDRESVPVVSIEYKAPSEFELAEITAGLKGEIRPAEDLINNESKDFEFLCKSLVAGTITRMFHTMVGKGVQFGYIFSGEAIIFLHIPADPSMVYYHLSVPRLDFQEDDDNRFHRTSVAQILAFVLAAATTEKPEQSWHDAVARLDKWPVEDIDILEDIPKIARKAPFSFPAYNPSSWKGFHRSPIQIRSRGPVESYTPYEDGDIHMNNSERDSSTAPTSSKTESKVARQQREGSSEQGRESGQDEAHMMPISRIGDRPYCTHECLLGLLNGGEMDKKCPNYEDHGTKHIDQVLFRRLVRRQLASDRGPDADCKPLFLKGSRGAILKFRLSSHGYTLVAKGMAESNRHHLLHESKVYNRIRPVQGLYAPVCLGVVDLKLPYYYDSGVYTSILLLSWAGRPLRDYLIKENETLILDMVDSAFRALHGLQVLQNDAEPRNIVWNEQDGSLMVVDYERAVIQGRLSLSPTQNQKRKRQTGMVAVIKPEDYEHERRSAEMSISRCISKLC